MQLTRNQAEDVMTRQLVEVIQTDPEGAAYGGVKGVADMTDAQLQEALNEQDYAEEGVVVVPDVGGTVG